MYKRFLSLLLLFVFSIAFAQSSLERTAPFTAVKWVQDNPYVQVDGDWHLLVSVNKTEAAKIVAFCKKEYGERWKKRFSEDLPEVMQKMGKPLSATVDLVLIKDSKTITRKASLTKENRRAVYTYNNANHDPETMTDQVAIVEQTQKDIAPVVNISMDKPFLCKSAKVEYTITGHKLFAGTETMYIDDYGKTVIMLIDKPGAGEKQTIIWKDNKSTVINHLKKTWFNSPIRSKSTEPPVISYSTELQRKQGGYSKQSNEPVAGKDCMVYKHTNMKVTYWLWKNVALKELNYSIGEKLGYTREATSIQENITIPAELFKIPDGYGKQ